MELNNIKDPKDIKNLSIKGLEQLSYEIRQFLIENLSKTGGHLAPNLGVVELTLALHYLFDSPTDKLIWDVGHQAYVHKIITGRANQFHTLRQFKGLSGFPKRSESEHDVWETGHSSTSLSAAMGLAIARDLKQEKHRIIPIIGDGALTGGMALEALNHIGHEKRKMMVILNDNTMSIAPNVGAIHNHLERLRTNERYLKVKDEIEFLMKKIPAIGGKVAKAAEKIKDSLKYLVINGALFEEMGLTYFGPIDGHNFEDLFTTLKLADKTDGPVLVHVVTKKGKGYRPAELNADKFHGISPYKIESGEVLKKEGPPTYTEVFSKTIINIAKKNSDVVAITAAMPSGTGLNKFQRVFPERFFDVGIAEQHATTLAAGLAIDGLKPVLAIYSTFLQRSYDQILHDVARQNLHVTFAIDRAGFVGDDGETHHGVFDIAYLRHLPNMTVMMPKDENELQHMLYSAVEHHHGPIAVRYPRGSGIGVQLDPELRQIPIGKFEIVKQGYGIAILAVGPMVSLAEQAAKRLEEFGIFPMVINARFIKPLDEELLFQLAEKHFQILTIEEGITSGGFGSSILEFYANNNLDHIDIKIMGIPDEFIEQGSIPKLRELVGLSVDNIVNQVRYIATKHKRRA
ncbi:1-deoxy-D-xylulose-5-phosphate synthase [Vulcanibacillus modesticaldus]|uniref:1-deoxy-D-xylulose-5-phosphate synthase n=1 Tax=Vulcanibacillus modesticaldus TaxID=337097 RepID=A0A1D2YRT6_9BACI|nr:1-deoxy-D-xylulose-5-phosphate synthase [Vulcanibacillus modesticaldus]OEF95525.1 1-deoxy-D-xylulose-5-phosphate synthase [Vulcanibacillus modesticaldus]